LRDRCERGSFYLIVNFHIHDIANSSVCVAGKWDSSTGSFILDNRGCLGENFHLRDRQQYGKRDLSFLVVPVAVQKVFFFLCGVPHARHDQKTHTLYVLWHAHNAPGHTFSETAFLGLGPSDPVPLPLASSLVRFPDVFVSLMVVVVGVAAILFLIFFSLLVTETFGFFRKVVRSGVRWPFYAGGGVCCFC
jgi:hypothetical protein